MHGERSLAAFQSTRWSLIDHLHDPDPADRAVALARLAEIYWPAVYGFLRRRGVSREHAEETTQAFFADVVLGRSLFDSAAPDKGRLRTLILAALKRYRVDRHRRDISRGADLRVHLDPERLERQEQTLARDGSPDPDSEFDRQWAASQVEEALRRCREHFEKSGKPDHWRLFEARVVAPSVGFTSPPPLTHAAEVLGFRSAADGAAAVQTVKKRFDSFLHDVIAESAGDDAAEELAFVLGSLGRPT